MPFCSLCLVFFLLSVRPTVAYINRTRLRHNIRTVLRHAATPVLAMVKADGYGHGAVECSTIFVEEGAAMLGVAYVDEAVALRRSGVESLKTARILIMIPPFPNEAEECCQWRLDCTIASVETARALHTAAQAAGITLGVHLYLDTGMRRDGIEPAYAVDFIRAISDCTSLTIEGICTHFATSDEADSLYENSFVRTQMRHFTAALQALRESGVLFKYVHAANSGALALHLASGSNAAPFSLTRSGIALYGYNASDDLPVHLDVQPALSLKTKIASIRRIPAGTSVSYGRTYRTEQESTLVTLPLGYADGLPRELSFSNVRSGLEYDIKKPRAGLPFSALLHGKPFPIVGRVCMDECMLNVGNEPCSVGDEVVIIGEQWYTNERGEHCKASIDAAQLACVAGTIHYEVLSRIGARVPRVYCD